MDHVIFSEIAEQVSDFDPITLAEMDSVKLMDRTDLKFMIPVSRLSYILSLVQSHYRVLEMESKRIFTYETLYYDTRELTLYHQHQAGRLNRYKIRHRNYVDTKGSYFEIKLKNNKGRTIKTRIKREMGGCGGLDEHSGSFLRGTTNLNPDRLKPTLWVHYGRITLVSIYTTERITIDLDLTFSSDGRSREFGYVAIVEVKHEKENSASFFLEMMRRQRFREGGISKYCFGMISIFSGVKHNRFKSKVKFLHKLQSQNALHVPVRHTQFI
ncbi:hypothetical protein DYBT9275_01028 [Dyadobacter sp. CECT 9275]|uniref:VTC domain-containing protein n=2 Tax=Dyadobacter helix TaxID=2822344 RepID=A0A916N4P1_9BACT|nr:hypothetical protein DYBT9275_01028 [Dyadobacter sp. CECT 9275]